MFATRTATRSAVLTARHSAAQAIKSAHGAPTSAAGLRPALLVYQATWTAPQRHFTSTPHSQVKEFFPAPESPHIKKTPAAWPHPVYTQEQMDAVSFSHRETRTMSDKVAMAMVRLLRWGLDLATGYTHKDAQKLAAMDPAQAKKYQMTEHKYLVRNVFLESVAGVPGMVAGMMRHLRSMRTMKRDNGWMETLLEESYNERMHLLTFLKLMEPGLFMRVMVLGAQGVFFNAFFFSYLISPKTCHRFVGYLEEEAVLTYTRELEDLDAGLLPAWETMTAPDIAVQYYQMPAGKRSMRDLLLYIRADEAKHREVNHTLGNLNQTTDPNPYVSEYKDSGKPHPTKDIAHLQPKGWEREDVI